MVLQDLQHAMDEHHDWTTPHADAPPPHPSLLPHNLESGLYTPHTPQAHIAAHAPEAGPSRIPQTDESTMHDHADTPVNEQVQVVPDTVPGKQTGQRQVSGSMPVAHAQPSSTSQDAKPSFRIPQVGQLEP